VRTSGLRFADEPDANRTAMKGKLHVNGSKHEQKANVGKETMASAGPARRAQCGKFSQVQCAVAGKQIDHKYACPSCGTGFSKWSKYIAHATKYGSSGSSGKSSSAPHAISPSSPTPRRKPAMELADAAGPEITLAAQIKSADSSSSDVIDECDSDGVDIGCSTLSGALTGFFAPRALASSAPVQRTTLYGSMCKELGLVPKDVELSLLGHLNAPPTVSLTARGQESASEIYINVTDPFCLIAVGVQGSGKSHTTACILESCLLPFSPVTGVRQPMACMVCHYDQSDANCCEATGLGQPSSKITRILAAHGFDSPAPSLSDDRLLVLCSPSFYKQRAKYYAGVCEVRPLLFRWSRLKAQQLKMLMKLDESSSQLYVALMLDMLRGYQRQEKVPSYEDFIRQLEEVCSNSQSGPLKQRFQLLSSFVYESDVNKELREVGADLSDVMVAGRMVVIDLTDPMVSPADANGVFQVLLEAFRFKQIPRVGKLVAFDEAHRYMGLHGESDALAHEITDCARLMRHEGLRVVISTQSPRAMPQELVELTTVLISHRFQSSDWHAYLAKKVPLPDGSFETIRALAPGEALIYSARPCIASVVQAHGEEGAASLVEVLRMQVRKRLTADLGASRVNRVERIGHPEP
jgi:hypothetical protein